MKAEEEEEAEPEVKVMTMKEAAAKTEGTAAVAAMLRAPAADTAVAEGSGLVEATARVAEGRPPRGM